MLKKGDLVTFPAGHEVHIYFRTFSETVFTVEEYEEIPHYRYDEDGNETDEIDDVEISLSIRWGNSPIMWVDPAGWKLFDPSPKEEQLIKKIKYLWERQDYVKCL